jgi:general secretion pathway protein J
MSARSKQFDPRHGEAGFTLIEMLVATMLMVFILVALATVTAQWLPNWNRGMLRVERDEHFAFGLNRIVADLSVAEFISANNTTKLPYFDGNELAVVFVRTAIGPNSHPGLEIVRFHEVGDANGPALIRDRAVFAPMNAIAPVPFADPVVLLRAPYRVMFDYAGADGIWQPRWRAAAMLPSHIRITVRDATTQQKLAVSTAALVHIDTPADCAAAKNVNQCLTQIAQATTTPGGSNQSQMPAGFGQGQTSAGGEPR